MDREKTRKQNNQSVKAENGGGCSHVCGSCDLCKTSRTRVTLLDSQHPLHSDLVSPPSEVFISSARGAGVGGGGGPQLSQQRLEFRVPSVC